MCRIRRSLVCKFAPLHARTRARLQLLSSLKGHKTSHLRNLLRHAELSSRRFIFIPHPLGALHPLLSVVPISLPLFRVPHAYVFIPPRFVTYRWTYLQVTLLLTRLRQRADQRSCPPVDLTIASPLDPGEVSYPNKGTCSNNDCKSEMVRCPSECTTHVAFTRIS